MDVFEIMALPPYAIRVTLDGPIEFASDGDLVAKVSVPATLAAALDAGAEPVVAASLIDRSEAEGADESLELFEPLQPSAYEPASKTVTVSVPSYIFVSDEDGARKQATLAIVAVGRMSSSASKAGGARSTAAASGGQCLMNNTTIFMPVEPRIIGSTAFGFYLAAGLFSEPRPDKIKGKDGTIRLDHKKFADAMANDTQRLENQKGNGHAGWDLTVDEGSRLMAPADGTIVKVKREDYSCENGTPPRKVLGKSDTYAVTLKLTKGGRIAFRHLKHESVRPALEALGKLDKVEHKQHLDTCWTAKGGEEISVRARDVIGLTGKTGAQSAHLHIDWAPAGEVDEVARRRNPLCLFGRSFIVTSTATNSQGDLGVWPTITVKAPLDLVAGIAERHDQLYVKRRKAPVSTLFNVSFFGHPNVTERHGYYNMAALHPGPGHESGASPRFPDPYTRGAVFSEYTLTQVSGPIRTKPLDIMIAKGYFSGSSEDAVNGLIWWPSPEGCLGRTDFKLDAEVFWSFDRQARVTLIRDLRTWAAYEMVDARCLPRWPNTYTGPGTTVHP